MKPVVFNGHAGWLHAADGDCGVVLCNPLGHEAIWLHQAMRQFADALASRGLPVLRFDYLGTGDSTDTGAWVRPGDWVAEVVEAADWLKRATSIARVSLAGFRFGGTVAALAARQVEIESIAMFAPVVSGRLFLREMNLLHQTWQRKAGFGNGDAGASRDVREIFGHRFSAPGFDRLGELDLCAEPASTASRVLIAHGGQHDGSEALAAHFASRGVPVESIDFPNYAEALRPPWLTESPLAMLNEAADWLSGPVRPGAAASSRTARDGVHPGLPVQGAVERPVKAGDGRLAGILCEPVRQGDSSAPVLLIANTAATHHVGDGRFGVELARQTALHGYLSLRVDADGIGDSDGEAPLSVPGRITYDSMTTDLSCWVDWLAARGHQQIVIFGICAGAYTAMMTARDHPAVRGLMLVNPASFLLPENCTVQQAARLVRGSPRTNLRSMVRIAKWHQVLRGEVSLAPVARTLWRHGTVRVQRLLAACSRQRLFNSSASCQVQRMFRRMDAAGTRVRLLFSPRDHALDEFYMHFGIGRHRLERFERLDARVLGEMDHEVLDRRARDSVSAECFALLHELSLAARTAPASPVAPGAQAEFTLI
ncbi:alpha/beta hydrolase [Burkholderia plantarii]|uniref:serine aminopeptidase domain-containing protein n=1 Tax=Burkholderia plantarii TaxID=41899 RepID=UPI00272BD5FC|nr:alpha/beta hydrolase [Burkholderia plantarii]WLE63220.1 alpha/beta hydrolase [Burkholderia plantarii]